MVLKEGFRVLFLSTWSHLYIFCIVGGKYFLRLCFSTRRSPYLWGTLSFSPDCKQMWANHQMGHISEENRWLRAGCSGEQEWESTFYGQSGSFSVRCFEVYVYTGQCIGTRNVLTCMALAPRLQLRFFGDVQLQWSKTMPLLCRSYQQT